MSRLPHFVAQMETGQEIKIVGVRFKLSDVVWELTNKFNLNRTKQADLLWGYSVMDNNGNRLSIHRCYCLSPDRHFEGVTNETEN